MWQPIAEAFTNLTERPAVLILIFGVVLLLLGLSGGIQYNNWFAMSDQKASLSLAVGLMMIIAGGFLSSRSTGANLSVKGFGVKITEPKEGQLVDIVDVAGTIKKLPPAGTKVMIFRVYPDSTVHPLQEVYISPDKKNWYARNCNIGGKSRDQRTIGVYLVGKSGQALILYYTQANEFHRAVKTKTTEFLPRISTLTDDMIKLDDVQVKRL